MQKSNDKSADRRHATILFADISGFTELSEKMEPDALRDAMQTCFHEIENIVVQRGGAIDKYIGDCAMALFGAPVALEQAARQAVNAAIEIRNGMRRLRESGRIPATLDVHIGVNSGLVVAGEVGGAQRRDYTVMGSAVNLASRLQSAATDGQIFVGSATHRYTREDFEYKTLRPLDLKGFEEPVAAYELLSNEERIHKPRPGSGAREFESELVGREREWDAVIAALEAVGTGKGSIVSVVGENGMGKSRLLAEAQQSTQAAALTFLEARSLSTGTGLSYYPFLDLFSQWLAVGSDAHSKPDAESLTQAIEKAGVENVEDVATALAVLMGVELDEAARERLQGMTGGALEKFIHRSVLSLLRAIARERPVAIVFEDLHWADGSSIDLLESVLSLAETDPICIILACRPDYADTSDRVLRYVETNHPASQRLLRLGRLSDSATDRLLDNLLGTDDIPVALRDLVKSNAEGNPFYVEEILTSLREQGVFSEHHGRVESAPVGGTVEIPASIGDVVMTRVDRLDSNEREVLQVAAIIGRDFQRGLLVRLLEDGAELDAVLDSLVVRNFIDRAASEQGSIDDSGGADTAAAYTFRHALIHEAVYESILKNRRSNLHAACARLIEQDFSERLQDVYGVLAYHFVRADQDEQAETYLTMAGAAAAESAASASALKHFRDAYEIYNRRLGENADPKKKAVFEKNIGTALVNTGDLLTSIEHFDASLELYGEEVPRSDRALWMKLARDLSAALFNVYYRPLKKPKAGNPPESDDIVHVFYNRNRATNPTAPRRSFFDNLAGIRYLGRLDPEPIEHACGMYAAAGAFFAFGGLSPRAGVRFLRIAEALAEKGSAGDKFQYLAMRSVFDFHVGDWDGGRDIDDDLLEEGLHRGLLWDADTYLGMVCERATRQGRFERSEKLLAKLRELHTVFGYGFARSTELAQRAFLLLEKRRLDEAKEALHVYYDSRHEDTLRILALSGETKIEVLENRLDSADQCLARAEKLIARSGTLPPFYRGAYCTARALRDVAAFESSRAGSDARRARKAVKRAIQCSAAIARERPEAHRVAGRLYFAAGDRKRAVTSWKNALDCCDALGMTPERARMRVEIAHALDGTPDLARLLTHHDAAECIAESERTLAELGLHDEIRRARLSEDSAARGVVATGRSGASNLR